MNKTTDGKRRGVVKGAPSGFVVSLLFHAAAFLIAGAFVVFTVVNKEEQRFVPPKPVDRPKMKLKKPKVQVKKNTKPRSTTRIVAKVRQASMPEIQLPEMSGIGEGLGTGGLDGLSMMPDLTTETFFGNAQSIGNDFVGTFYDFTRDRLGKPTLLAPENMFQKVKDFMVKGWNPNVFSQYYRSPNKLYATFFCVPTEYSTLGPAAFGHPEASSWCWIVHYKGKLVYKDDITFRFWGQGDDYMIVRVDGQIVLIACWPQSAEPYYTQLWRSTSPDNRIYPLGNNRSVVGDWVELKAGEPKDMEVLIGEGKGGLFAALLTVEVKGEKYDQNPFLGGPTLPIFKTEELSQSMVEDIGNMLHEGDACLTNGPVFKDYESRQAPAVAVEPVAAPEPETAVPPAVDPRATRVWTSVDGKTMEGEYVTKLGNQAVIQVGKGKQIKIPLDQLAGEDRSFIELENPPELYIDFYKASDQIPPPHESPYVDLHFPIRISDFTFGVQIKQKTTDPYNHRLHVEYFAIGEEVDGNNYVLLDHRDTWFDLNEANKREFQFLGDKVRVQSKATWPNSPMRGVKYGGYLVIVTDERGKVVQYAASSKFLYDYVENLRKIPLTRHFDRECLRVAPPRPTFDDRNPYIWNR